MTKKLNKKQIKVVKDYIVDGFAIDFDKITPEDVEELEAEIRKRVSKDEHFYGRIKLSLKDGTASYTGLSETKMKKFFASVQDKLFRAVTGKTANEIKFERADYTKPNMGLHTFAGKEVRQKDCLIAKNYLTKDELERYERICELLLSVLKCYVDEGKGLTMEELNFKVYSVLNLLGYNVFGGRIPITSKKVKVSTKTKKKGGNK